MPTVFGFDDAIAAGYSAADVRRHLRSGAWVRLRRSVYAEKATVERARMDPVSSHALDCAAALRAMDGDTVVSDESAALLHGIALLQPPSQPNVTTERAPRSGSRTMDGVHVYTAGLPATHRTIRHSLPLTTAARTVIDIARHQPFDRAVVTADSALQRGMVTPDELALVLEHCSGWPFIAKAERVASFADPLCESPLESLCRICFDLQGLPPPRSQVWIGNDRVDFLWEEYRTVGEADGMSKYTDPAVLREEKLREDRLRERGFEVVRITWAQLMRNPAEVAARVRAAFARGLRSSAS